MQAPPTEQPALHHTHHPVLCQGPTAAAHLSCGSTLCYFWVTWWREDSWGCGNQAAAAEFGILEAQRLRCSQLTFP